MKSSCIRLLILLAALAAAKCKIDDDWEAYKVLFTILITLLQLALYLTKQES